MIVKRNPIPVSETLSTKWQHAFLNITLNYEILYSLC